MAPDPRTTLAAAPRVDLGFWPTPLHPCEALRARVGGPLVWLKRDDCSGLALGGNKTRKLEFLLGEATATGASGVVTFGAVQSNHARQTAAACARLGLPCDLILTELVDRDDPAYAASGNRLLDDLLGATVHVVPDVAAAGAVLTELLDAHPDRYVIPPGGSTPVGTLGYVAAAIELADQLTAAGVGAAGPVPVVTAASTGGTAAGLAVGASLAAVDLRIEVVAVHGPAGETGAAVTDLARATADLLATPAPDPDRRTVHDDHLGPGYGIETVASREALELLARSEGVVLDPVYTAKAFAHLVATLPEREGDHVVFLHTGGQPGVFAYG